LAKLLAFTFVAQEYTILRVIFCPLRTFENR